MMVQWSMMEIIPTIATMIPVVDPELTNIIAQVVSMIREVKKRQEKLENAA